MNERETRNIRDVVNRFVQSGQIKRPPLATVVAPADYAFIRELKHRGDSNGKVAAVLHVTPEALQTALKAINLT